MPVTTPLTQLRERAAPPIRDGFHLVDRRAFAVHLDEQAPGWLKVHEPLALDSFLGENPE